MKKRISVLIVLALLLLSFTSCNLVFKPKGEEATVKSDADSVNINDTFEMAEEKISLAESAKSVANSNSFNQVLLNPDTSAASYNGSEDIVIEHTEAINKTVSVKTSGSVTLSSQIDTLVLQAAKKGFTSEAKAENILIKGTDITADINYETGCIYIEGKNAVINVKEPAIGKIVAKNSTAVINNYSDADIYVTLVNGTKVTVPSNHKYEVKDNLIYKL